MRRLAAAARSTAARWALIAATTFVIVTAARLSGVLEPIDLLAYDGLIRLRAAWSEPSPPPVTVVSADDDDLNRWGWPLSDALLAQAIERLEALQPRAIGIDLYRDRPRPPGAAALAAALGRYDNVIVAFKFGGGETAIPPPEALRDTDRAGFADTIADAGGVVRRTLLFLDDGETVATSLALRLALEYLKPRGIGLAADPADPTRLRLGATTLPPFAGTAGGYVGADDAGYQLLIDFRDGAAGFPRLSLSTVLEGPLPPELVRQRIVILGVGAESVKDYFFTPFSSWLADGRTIYGNQLHGHIAAQLVRHAVDAMPPTLPVPPAGDHLWVLLCCMAGAAVGLGLRSPLWLAAASGSGLLLLAGVTVAGFALALWQPIAPPAMGWLTAAMLGTALGSKEERTQRELLMQIFSRNVSPAIAEAMWQQRGSFMEGGRPRPQRLTATVLFTDLRGFTSISESLDPQELMRWLDTYMEGMTNVVLDHGGVLDKFIGDAVMAVFGVPIARSGRDEIAADAVRAVECALAMGRTLADLNRRWQAEGRPQAQMRVGIYTGTLVAGTVGSARRLNYTVIGDTVNTASRLESFDKAVGAELTCRILVGAPTLDYLGGRFRTRPVGEVALKGKAARVAAFLVEDGPEAAPPSPPASAKEANHA